MLQKKAEDWDNKLGEMQDNGEEEDRKEGAARFLGRLLEQKFGPLDEQSRERLAAADFERLIAWTDRMLDARNLPDVFKD